MSITRDFARGASWLFLFRSFSQAFSWGSTLILARLLVPEDYGLMEMATVLTGYVALFSELGLGSAIIQRRNVSCDSLSSLFWLLQFWGLLLGFVCFGLAYPTARLFGDVRLIPITQGTAPLFVLGALQIVPRTILNRDLRFKAIGATEGISVIASCVAMIVLAYCGSAVWTLLGGQIVREFLKTVLSYVVCDWRPHFHFRKKDIEGFLGFGLNIACAQSLDYVTRKSDRFFAGKVLGGVSLGYYSMALQLASVPNEKIVSIVNNIAYPVFSKYQEDKEEANRFLILIIQALALVTLPLFFGGAVVGGYLLEVLLGQEWGAATVPFRLLCIGQAFIAITSPFSVVNTAQGRPNWVLKLNLISSLLMPMSFYLCAGAGLSWVAVPWIVIQPLIRLEFAYLTLRKMDISGGTFIRALHHPLVANFVMLVVAFGVGALGDRARISHWQILCSEVMSGVIAYSSYLLYFCPELVEHARATIRFRQAAQ